MKKVYLFLTLFITSFFFVFSEVRAEINSFVVPEEEMSLFNENFNTLREATIDYCIENNKKYIISCNTSNFTCTSNIFDDGTVRLGATNNSLGYFPTVRYGTVSTFQIKNGLFTQTGTSTSYTYFYVTASKSFTYKSFVDTNLIDLSWSHDAVISYDDFTLDVPTGTPFPSLYQFYNAYNTPSDRFIEEREVISNFYSLILEKLVLLSNYFINNFFLMLILAIFILIFIFEIIRRRIL